MTTIVENNPHATLINVFTVAPENAAELVAILTEATEQVMQHVPGFVSANIHLSSDGTRVVNYAQWESADAYQKVFADDTAREHMSKAASLAENFDPHLYTVESVHER